MSPQLAQAIGHLLEALTGNELSELQGQLDEARRRERYIDGEGVRQRAEAAGSRVRLAAAYLDEEADCRGVRRYLGDDGEGLAFVWTMASCLKCRKVVPAQSRAAHRCSAVD